MLQTQARVSVPGKPYQSGQVLTGETWAYRIASMSGLMALDTRETLSSSFVLSLSDDGW
jgi:hypothetical protein